MTATDRSPAMTHDHTPLRVLQADGWITVVDCSCDVDHLPELSVWVKEHHGGSEEDALAALRAVIARQDAEPARTCPPHEPSYERSECAWCEGQQQFCSQCGTRLCCTDEEASR